ncbi:DUF3320 domain-containing protein [Stutzerimonas kirkiae]|uniref:DUF3320 domain-containing protein n=1 Tax=Stutzerimonas kirkiae TaxID=2211392 RepID=UPI00103834EA|nr:hypothetical protein DNK08_08935 [Stutzerimonas kirkiae]
MDARKVAQPTTDADVPFLEPPIEARAPDHASAPLLYAQSAPVASVALVAEGRADNQVKPIYLESTPEATIAGIDPDAFLTPAYDETLVQLVAHIIESKGPVLDQTLARRVARAHGWTRTGGGSGIGSSRWRADTIAATRNRSANSSGRTPWPLTAKSFIGGLAQTPAGR